MNAKAGIIIRPVHNLGLVGYWDFQEGAGNIIYDKSGYDNDGIWAGAGSHWTDGKIGKGGSFNGSDDYIDLARVLHQQVVTITAWVRPNAMASIKSVLSKTRIYEMDVDGSNYLGCYVGNSYTWGTPHAHPASSYTDSSWSFFTCVYDGTNLTAYQNGIPGTTVQPNLSPPSSSNESIAIGRYGDGSYYFSGFIDEVRIYNRALSESEIERLYKLSQPKIGINQLGLVPDDLPANATISYVREDCTGYSPCYDSLYDWELNFGGFDFADHSCTPGDLTCLNKTAVARIDGTWNAPDATAFYIDGWTTNAANYIYIYTTASARHPGKWDETKYRLQTSSDGIYIYEEYVRISGLQIKLVTSTNYKRAIFSVIDNANSDIRISDNVITSNCSSSLMDCAGIGTNWNVAAKLKIWNNIIYDMGYGIIISQGSTAQVYNNTVIDGFGYGFYVNGAGNVVAKNNISYNNIDNYVADTVYDDYSRNNLSGPSSDASIPSTNARNGVRVNFVDAANDDFHLSPADSGARNYGVDLSNDTSISFPFDIDRQDRKGTWDIGADEARGSVIGGSQANQISNGLVGYWSFNGPDIDGNTAYDRSGQGNHGTITSAGYATPARVNQNGNKDDGNAHSISVSLNNSTVGNVLIIGAARCYYGTDIDESQFSGSNIGTVHLAVTENGSQCKSVLLWTTITANGTTQVTWTLPGSEQAYLTMGIAEYSGVDTSNPIHSTNKNFNTIANATTGDISALAGELLVVFVGGDSQSYTQNAAYSVVYNQPDPGGYLPANMADRVVTTTNTYNHQWTNTSDTWVAIGASFKAKYLGSGATPTDGKVGQALSFDGANDYVGIADSASLLDLPNTALTFSAWVKVNNNGDATFLFDKKESTTTSGWGVSIDEWRRATLNIQRATIDLSAVTSLNTMPSFPSTWFHFAVTYPGGDNASNVHIYVNGSEISSFTAQTNGEGNYVSDSGLEARIGRNAYSTYATANIDEVRIYNRALEPSEIQRLYNLGR